MTPKEKARDLINKFSLKVLDTHLGGSNRRVIDCALIAVDELLEDKVEIDGMRVINDSYWMEVKQELLNLKNK